MLTCNFLPNTVLKGMTYNAGSLKILFCKGQEREYINVPPPIAYGLFYTKTATETLSYYSNNIKGKYTVLTVKNL